MHSCYLGATLQAHRVQLNMLLCRDTLLAGAQVAAVRDDVACPLFLAHRAHGQLGLRQPLLPGC